jgi:hypothetical protein
VKILAGVGVLLASLPLGILVTLALLPLWRWVERTQAIESVGHSGPAEWCYAVTTLVCAVVLGAIYVAAVRRGGR